VAPVALVPPVTDDFRLHLASASGAERVFDFFARVFQVRCLLISAFGVLWGAPEGPDESLRTEETVRFWEHDPPLQMTDLAAQLEPGHRFDSIVVDEAQDFADAWWDPLLAALKDDEAGGLYVFTDEGQRVFNRHGSPPVPLVPLILDHNVRNTRQIANAFQPLVDREQDTHDDAEYDDPDRSADVLLNRPGEQLVSVFVITSGE
jgi:hypothetical protein